MNKYLRAAICISYSLVKFGFLKIFYGSGFRFKIFNIVSPFTEVELDRNAKLYLGNRVRIRSGSKIKVRTGAQIKIGENTSFNHGCIVIAHEKITVGDNVQLGPNVLIYDHDHDFKNKDGLKNLVYVTSPVEIGDNTWIGANAVILRGTKIGRNCVVAAGTILSGEKTYSDNSIIFQKREISVKQYLNPDLPL